jgi:hypothetical protein
MGPWLKARTIGGCLCLLAALLLMSPGVRAVRAADGDTATVAPGPVCSSRPDQLRAGVAALPPHGIDREMTASDRIVVLNSTGYNYAPGGRRPAVAPSAPPAPRGR